MIERSEVKCRKDSLWQRMLIGGKLEEKDNVSLWMKKKHLDKIGSMCYIYLLCVSLSVTIILKQHNQLWTEEISPVFRGSKGMIMFVKAYFWSFHYVTMPPPPSMHEINKFEEWFVFSQNLKVYMFLLCDRLDQTCTTFFYTYSFRN